MSAGKRALLIIPLTLFVIALIGLALVRSQAQSQEARFELVEATIADVHRAIQQGQITCQGLVQAYIERARAYNGLSDRLVTRDGAPIPPARGTVRAGKPADVPNGDGRRLHAAARISTSMPDRLSSSGAWNRRHRIRTCSSSTA